MVDYSVGSRPGHLGKGVGKRVGVLAHLLLRFRSSSRLEDKMSPVNSPEGKLGVGCLGRGEMDGKVLNHQESQGVCSPRPQGWVCSPSNNGYFT